MFLSACIFFLAVAGLIGIISIMFSGGNKTRNRQTDMSELEAKELGPNAVTVSDAFKKTWEVFNGNNFDASAHFTDHNANCFMQLCEGEDGIYIVTSYLFNNPVESNLPEHFEQGDETSYYKFYKFESEKKLLETEFLQIFGMKTSQMILFEISERSYFKFEKPQNNEMNEVIEEFEESEDYESIELEDAIAKIDETFTVKKDNKIIEINSPSITCYIEFNDIYDTPRVELTFLFHEDLDLTKLPILIREHLNENQCTLIYDWAENKNWSFNAIRKAYSILPESQVGFRLIPYAGEEYLNEEE